MPKCTMCRLPCKYHEGPTGEIKKWAKNKMTEAASDRSEGKLEAEAVVITKRETRAEESELNNSTCFTDSDSSDWNTSPYSF